MLIELVCPLCLAAVSWKGILLNKCSVICRNHVVDLIPAKNLLEPGGQHVPVWLVGMGHRHAANAGPHRHRGPCHLD